MQRPSFFCPFASTHSHDSNALNTGRRVDRHPRARNHQRVACLTRGRLSAGTCAFRLESQTKRNNKSMALPDFKRIQKSTEVYVVFSAVPTHTSRFVPPRLGTHTPLRKDTRTCMCWMDKDDSRSSVHWEILHLCVPCFYRGHPRVLPTVAQLAPCHSGALTTKNDVGGDPSMYMFALYKMVS